MGQPILERIRTEIRTQGPISFARFMERALTEPGLGYYVGTQPRAGRDGDFMTAPEMHSLLGSALARLIREAWERLDRPQPFRYTEYGAGSGALLLAVIDQLIRDESPLLEALQIQPIEINPHRREELQRALATRALVKPLTIVAPDAQPVAGVVVANEYLDALPFHIYVGRAATTHGVAERCVGVNEDGALVWVEVPLGESEAMCVRARFGAPLAEGQRAEACFAADLWPHELAKRISDGLVVVIDYGREGADLRDAASRAAGTALAYQGHRATDDLLGDPGGRDLTAHVDLTALRAAATAAGLTAVASTSQAALLAGAGLDDEIERIRRGPEATLEGAIALRSALARLMNPRGMGGFAVELFALGSAEHVSRLADARNPLPGAAAPIRPLV
jgi:SAM-dependent MidA family methyltransferase